MARIKIISNPYEKEISFLSYREQSESWDKIEVYNPNSKLREDESGKSFLPFVIKEIVDIIIDEYYIGTEKIEIVFEGTNEEYREVEKVCLAEDVSDKVFLSRNSVMLENARSILKDTKEVFKNVQPIIEKIVRDDKAVLDELNKVSDALDDIVPICVFGNYSAGKSTFINALIGSEVLPSGGDPVTAKIYEIKRSEHPDIARISFDYDNNPIRLIFDDGVFRVLTGDLELEMIKELFQIIREVEKNGLFVVVNKALEFINGYEKREKSSINISNVIEVDIPFLPNGILGQSQNNFVIFDTPGSNSASNSEHSVVLEEALKGFSNGIPVWISQYESIDSDDNAALCDKILNIKALDPRFTMIVLNKADGSDLPEGGFTPKQTKEILEYRAVEKMYSSGIFFVSSVMGLGAKNKGDLRDKHYRKIYRSQQEMYSDPDDVDYAMLYKFNIMPEQIKAEISKLSSNQTDLVYANSGLYCIEKEMEDFASKYSAYNKCQMVYSFLNEVITETSRRITARTASLKRTRANREKELNIKKQELIQKLSMEADENEAEYGRTSRSHIRDFIDKKMDYSYKREDLAFLDSEVAARYSSEADFSTQERIFEKSKDAMWNHLKSHGAKLFSSEFKSAITGMKDDFSKDIARVRENKSGMDIVRREVGNQTSDFVLRAVIEKYKSSMLDAKERLVIETQKYCQKKAFKLKELLISIITESDALSGSQRDQLSSIIVKYKPVEFNDNADDVFIKTKFLRGNFLGFQTNISDRLNIPRLASRYNDRIAKNIRDMGMDLTESCIASFKKWASSLLVVIEQNITVYNPQLRDMAEMIREETEKIIELENDQNTICSSLEAIKQMMSWKESDFEELKYGC